MPLLDHFRPPLSERRPWESFHATWCGSIADHLNEALLPPGFLALEQVSPGPAIEIDVATVQEPPSPGRGVVATQPRTPWLPSAPPLTLPLAFPTRHAVEVHSTEGARSLVAAIDLVSPGNKDRASKRRQFAGKCANYLARSVGLVMVDAVTTRPANLHNDLIELLALWDDFLIPPAVELYAAAYRPLNAPEGGQVQARPFALALGQVLPTVPLSLSADCCLALDLEVSYLDACQRRRLEEALG